MVRRRQGGPLSTRRRAIALRAARCAAPSCAARWHEQKQSEVRPTLSRTSSPPLLPTTPPTPVAARASTTCDTLPASARVQ